MPTSKCDQNPLESDFNCLRAMGGSNVDPNGLELAWRLKKKVITRILSDKSFDYTSINDKLKNHLDSLKYGTGEDEEETDDEDDDLGDDNFEDDQDQDDQDQDDQEDDEGGDGFDFSALLSQNHELEEIYFIEDEEGNMVPKVKELLKDDELEGLHWVCVPYLVHNYPKII